MSTAREQQTIDIQRQFMTEIIVDIITAGILNIEILIPFGHRMILRNMGNHIDAISYLTRLIHSAESVLTYLWPHGRNAVQVPSFRKEDPVHRLR